MSPASKSPSRPPFWLLSVLLLVPLLLYGKAALDNDLVYDAAERALLLNTTEETRPAPLTGAVLQLEKAAVWDAEAADPGGDGFQWWWAILAALAALAAYSAYRTVFGISTPLAAWGAVLLVVHPAVSSAVFVGTSGRGALLALLFSAAAVTAWVRPGVVWGVAGALLGAWAALSHPQALPVLLLLPLLEVQDEKRENPEKSWPRLVALGVALVAAVGLWIAMVGLPGFAGLGDPLNPLRSLGYGLTTALVPTWQALPQPTFSGWWGVAGPLRLGIAVVLLILLVVGFRKAGAKLRGPLGLALVWTGLTLLPALQIFEQHPAYVERYLALPLFGLVALVALVVSRLPGRVGALLLRGAPVPLALLIALSASRADAFRDAETYHRQWVATSPDSADAQVGLAVAVLSGDSSGGGQEGGGEDQAAAGEALDALRRAAELAPEDAVVHRHLGDLLRAQGQREEAIAAYRKALELDPESSSLNLRLGEIYLAEGKPTEAEASFRKAADLAPGEVRPRRRLATSLARLGRQDEAIAVYEEMLAEKPDDLEAQARLRVDYGNLLADLGRPDEALAAYRRALELDPQLAAAHYNMGLAYLGQGRGDEALSSFREALAVKPDYPEAQTNLGVVLAGRGQVEEALEHYREAARLRPNDAGAHFNLGQGLILAGQVDEGLKELRQGIRLEPNNPSGHMLLGQTLMSLGRQDAAVGSLQSALRLRPQWVEPMIPLAWILATTSDDTLRDGETAVRLAETATHQTQYRNLDALNALAAAYAEVGRFDRAVELINEVIRRLEMAGQSQEVELVRPFLEHYQQGKVVRTRGA